jgi:molybdopterin-binding protein
VVEYLRIGEVAKAVGVSVDTLRRWESDGRVAFERVHNQRMLPSTSLPQLMALKQVPPNRSSARNRLEGVVTSVKKDGVMAQVELVCGDFRIVSLLSSEAVEEMGLEVGSPATAVVKATNVVVESR